MQKHIVVLGNCLLNEYHGAASEKLGKKVQGILASLESDPQDLGLQYRKNSEIAPSRSYHFNQRAEPGDSSTPYTYRRGNRGTEG